MNRRIASAKVPEIRQETQYTCCAASISACLQAHGKTQSEEDVNKVLNASPFRGASWEGILATLQYFGMRGSLVVPCTVAMLKKATDNGYPILIAWNPRNRPWSHASVVFDVTGEPGSYLIHVMDPNLADPSKSVMVLSEEDFYSKWYEKVSEEILVRRPGCIVEREVSKEGRQMIASLKKNSSEIFVNDLGMAFDDEGHKVNVGTSFPEGTYTPSSWGWKRLTEAMSKNQTTSLNLNRWEEESVFYERWARLALTMGEDWEYKFLISISQWVDKRKPLSEKQLAVIDRMKKKYKNQLNDIEGAIQEIWDQNRKVASRYASRFKFTVTGIPNPVEKYPASIQEATNWAMAVSKRMPRARMLLETPVTKLLWDTMNWKPLGL